jgi:hypothetical protein
MPPIEIFFIGLIIVAIASRLIGYRVNRNSPPSPPNKVAWDLEREG